MTQLLSAPVLRTTASAKRHIGWTAGAGLEYAFTENISGLLEYDYADLGAENYFPGVYNPTGVNTSITAHIAKIGLNLKY